MDGSHFDTLAKTLAATGSRRQALGGLLIAALALLGGHTPEEAQAAKSIKQCKKIEDKKRRQRCIKKAKQATETPTAITLPADAPVVGQAPPPPPAAIPVTCSDGIQNGNESDVDCGGPDCLRCGFGQRCASQSDCATALCVNNVCQVCSTDAQCGNDSNGGCLCKNLACTTRATDHPIVTLCLECPPYSTCLGKEAGLSCFAPCGSA
jgi:hypothetical protein